MSSQCKHPRRCSPRRLFIASILLAALVPSAQAQLEILRSRTATPNGRTVQEIRLGEDPGGATALRMAVITNGPTSGTTSLFTAVGDVDNWLDVGLTAPAFAPVIASGAIFSLGSGCRRGGQLDFPFIQDNRPKILRFNGGAPAVINVPIADTHAYDSADCTVSGDGTRTFFIFTDRTDSRLKFFSDTGGANDLVAPLTTFASVETPFSGGLRPSISVMPGTPRSVALLFMQTDGSSRWLQLNTAPFNLDFNCLAGTQTPPPSAFTIPRGARVAGQNAIADFNNDGVFDFISINTGNCATAPTPIAAGPVAGTGYNWTEPAVARSMTYDFYVFLYGQMMSRRFPAIPVAEAGPHSGSAGSFAACAVGNTETPDAFISAAAENLSTIRVSQSYYRYLAALEDLRHRSGMERPTRAQALNCIVRTILQ
jgi:hypothetical protein